MKFYRYNFGKDGPKGSINSYSDLNDVDDLFDICGILVVHRNDKLEMKEDEIEKIRKDFFYDSNIEEIMFGADINSVYKDKKLYFFISGRKIFDFSSEEELLRFIDESVTRCFLSSRVKLMHRDHKLINRELGFDLIFYGITSKWLTKLQKDEADFYECVETPDIAIICIYDFDILNKEFKYRHVTDEEIEYILKNTVKYVNRLIILYNIELSKDIIEYLKSQNIEIKSAIDIMKDRKMCESKLNDINVHLPDIKMSKKDLEKINKALDDIEHELGPKF